MSINVTVTGNPVSIQKGRMVTASPNHSKKEFERRRLIRISQVRQQSKNIAEDVRNRVKQQKLKQIEEIEKEGQKKLKQWQAKKLLELQNQCHEALKDIGVGHKGASLLEDEENLLLDKKEKYERVARERAEVANRKLQEEKSRIKHNASVPILKKRFVRQMENKRARMISGLRHSSQSPKKKTDDKLSNDIEVSGRVTESDSDYEDIDESILKVRSGDTSFEIDKNSQNFKDSISSTLKKDEMKNNENNHGDTEKLELSDRDDQLLKELRDQKDTRISDRIKRRSSHQLIQPDLCDSLAYRKSDGNIHKCPSEKDVANTQSKTMFSSIQQNIYACSCSKQSPVIPSPVCCGATSRMPSAKKPISNINSLKCFDTTDEEELTKKNRETQKNNLKKTSSKPVIVPSASPEKRVPVREIPTRPKVTLKSVKSPIKPMGVTSRTPLQSKSSRSRFLSAHVERITEDSLIISPEATNNDEFLEKIRQRDRDALIRGQKALEKEKLQREYNDLMKKLPALQKLERLYEMNKDKPEYHMTEERLREQDKKKQSILDDTYEKLFPDRRPPLVTIPVKNTSRAIIEEEDKISINRDYPVLNLGLWENEKKTKKLYTEEEVEVMLREGKIPSESKLRTDQLKSVLGKLRKQKEEILKEIQAEKLSNAVPFTSIVRSKNDGSSSDSSTGIYAHKKEKSKVTQKKYVSVKVGTNSLQNSSSSEELTKKQPPPVKQTVKSKSKEVQAAPITKKTKSPTVQKFSKETTKTIIKEQKIKKDISSSSEQSLSDTNFAQISKRTKSPTVQKSPKEGTKIVKEQKIRRDISSSSEQSLPDTNFARISKRTKSPTDQKSAKEGTKNVKEQKIRRDISSSSEQSLPDTNFAQISKRTKSPTVQKSPKEGTKNVKEQKIRRDISSASEQSTSDSQVAHISKKTKSSAIQESFKEKTKNIVKEQKKGKEISSSNELLDLKRSSSKESVKSTNVVKPDKGQQKTEKDKIIILGNTVIPSVPTNSLTSINELDAKTTKVQNNQIKSCDCEKDISKKSAELCEIVIKIKDGKSSEVLIKDKSEGGNDKVQSVTVEKPKPVEKSKIVQKPAVAKKPEKMKEPSSNQRYNEIRNALNDDCCHSKDSSKPESWHEKFSKNNSQFSTSSTSYMSPPHLPNKPVVETKTPPYFCNLIGRKPQQRNLNEMSPPTKLPVKNQDVLGEVQKLLAMSRQSIDELGVSSVSTVTTPSQSIIDLDSNKANSTPISNNNTRIDLLNELCQSRSQTTLPNFSFLTVSSDNRTIIASEIDTNEQYPDILAKYAKIADQCSQRISDLTSMIEKVREDKNRMLQTSSLLPTNDSSTKYMDLPSPNKSKDSANEQKSTSSGSTSSSADSKLLDINFSLAEKLKGLTPEQVRNFGKEPVPSNSVNNNKGEEDLAKRLKALKEPLVTINETDDNKVEEQVQTIKLPVDKGSISPPKNSHNGDSVDFVPLLLDIPKLPALATDSSSTKHKKPPPSKSFLAARKFTDFIAPHELSTIPEQDSQMRFESTLRDKSPVEEKRSQVIEIVPAPKKSPPLENKLTVKSPIETNNVKSDQQFLAPVNTESGKPKPFVPITGTNVSSPINNRSEYKLNKNTSSPSKSQSKSSGTKESTNHSDNSLGSSNTSCDEKVEMLRIEAMLRSIGMEWAISTLRKTQEALALTSSSSSIDVKSPSTLKNLSEDNIKEYLSKQMFQKISSSTLRTDASPGSLNESQEFSDIRHAEFVYKQTSTPVNRSRERIENPEKSSDLPSAIESDKMTNDFFSLPEHSP